MVNASVTRRSAYDTGGIPTLDGDTQTLDQKLSGSRLVSGDSNYYTATNVSEKYIEDIVVVITFYCN